MRLKTDKQQIVKVMLKYVKTANETVIILQSIPSTNAEIYMDIWEAPTKRNMTQNIFHE